MLGSVDYGLVTGSRVKSEIVFVAYNYDIK